MSAATLGIILAGGRATRMGGIDKALLDLCGQTLIHHVAARISPQCSALIISANGDAGRFAELGLPVIADTIPYYPGPLAGVLAGMDHAASLGLDCVLTVAADTPFVPRDMADRLHRAVAEQCRPIGICATRSATGVVRHPTCGLWPTALRDDLRASLLAGQFKVGMWAERHGVALAEFEVGACDPFFNINTPDDLQAARKILAHARGAAG